MKTYQILGCVAGLALAGQASANLVITGNFESGSARFTSDYKSATPGLPAPISGNHNTMWDEGTYTVYKNIQATHELWTYGPAGDHTTGTGNMMIVNGATTPNQTVWAGSLSSSLIAGQTYSLSAWVANIYPQSPPELVFTVGGNPVGGTVTFADKGVWQQFSATFVATGSASPQLMTDINLQASGNDFVLDDISVTAVPEPTTVLAGALLLLPFGVSTIRSLRRKA